MKKKQTKKMQVQVDRAFMFAGEMVKPGDEKKPVVVSVAELFGRELIANGKAHKVDGVKDARELSVKSDDEFDLGD